MLATKMYQKLSDFETQKLSDFETQKIWKSLMHVLFDTSTKLTFTNLQYYFSFNLKDKGVLGCQKCVWT